MRILHPLVCLVTILAACGQGCDLHVELINAPPSVTWVQAAPASDGIVELTVWVYDLEQAPVDLDLSWSLDGVDQGALTLASGGHGTLGLTTAADTLEADGRPDPDGRPHVIRWALPEDIAGDARLHLHASADDRVSEPGPRVSTPAEGFTALEGLPTPARMSVQ